MKKIFIFVIAVLLTACGGGQGGGSFPMMGGSNMMDRHHAQVPAEYAGKTAPALGDQSLANGETIYAQNCQSCHGADGMGTGPIAETLDPAPSPIAHTTQMLADDLVYYRIGEGGAEFQTSMPAWKDVLTEEQIWDVIAYVRALGRDNAVQVDEMRAAQQEAMLKKAMDEKVISTEEADTFRTVHDALEGYVASHAGEGTTDEREAAALAALVADGTFTQKQVDEFARIHDLLAEKGLMP